MRIGDAVGDLKRYARFERVLALFCAVSPALMIAGGGWPTEQRDSISAYYDIAHSQWFYVPLTAAAMLFLVNGFVRNQNLYNAWLGGLLAGVVLFNHADFHWVHMAFAVAFFAGSVGVVAFYSRGVSGRFRAVVLVGAVTAFAAWKPLGWYHLFWAEWIALGLIAAHFLLDASKADYRAADRGEGPALAAA